MRFAAIDYGSRLRVGLLIPSGNSVAEPEIRAMLPTEVSPLVTRLSLKGSSEKELLGMLDQLEPATALLADAGVDVIGFHCTAVSTFEPNLAEDIRTRIQTVSNVKCITTADAIVEALNRLDAKRVALLSPYLSEVHEREILFLEENGFSIDGSAHMGINTNTEMAKLSPQAIAEWAQDKISTRADACFLSCTAIKSAPVIAQLETMAGIPVLTSNQCMVWHLLRTYGIESNQSQFGRLFEVGSRPAQ